MPTPDYDQNSPPPLTADERMRIRSTAADLASKLERVAGQVPRDTWRSYAARRIGDALVAERNRTPLKR